MAIAVRKYECCFNLKYSLVTENNNQNCKNSNLKKVKSRKTRNESIGSIRGHFYFIFCRTPALC
jgi:hypothetical protein